MYVIPAMVGVMLLMWGVAVWASRPEAAAVRQPVRNRKVKRAR